MQKNLSIVLLLLLLCLSISVILLFYCYSDLRNSLQADSSVVLHSGRHLRSSPVPNQSFFIDRTISIERFKTEQQLKCKALEFKNKDIEREIADIQKRRF